MVDRFVPPVEKEVGSTVGLWVVSKEASGCQLVWDLPRLQRAA